MWSWSSLVFMIAMKQLLGYVLHPVGVEMCREFCRQVTGKPFCIYSPTALLCQVTHRNRLQAADQWIILEISTRRRAIYESKRTTCAVHSRLHRSRTKGVKCVADLIKDYHRGTVGRETIYIKRVNAATSWDSANTMCERDGGQLVKVDNKETLQEVAKLFTPVGFFGRVEVWIGLRDLCDNKTFLWLDGQAPVFTKWALEERYGFKKGGRHGKCVKMRSSLIGMEWLSESCDRKHGYICQLLLPDKTTTLPKGEICNESLKH